MKKKKKADPNTFRRLKKQTKTPVQKKKIERNIHTCAKEEGI